MKKLFVSFLTLILVVLTAAGCGSSADKPIYNSAKNGEWVEIQSITYDLNGTIKKQIGIYSSVLIPLK